jgi:hypothetical protein
MPGHGTVGELPDAGPRDRRIGSRYRAQMTEAACRTPWIDVAPRSK